MPTDLPNERTLRRPGLVELDPSSDDIGADETAKLIGSRKVVGAAVYNSQGEGLGSIDEVMIDKLSGLVAYAVLSSGGFLGLGETRHPLPWNALTYSVELSGYVVDLDVTATDPAPVGPSGPLAAG